MYSNKWYSLRKTSSQHYVLSPPSRGTSRCTPKISFMQLAFSWDEECLIATDSTGDLYYIDLTEGDPYYQKLGKVGHSTFLAFNPIDKHEIIVGLTNADIKLCKINDKVSQFCLLTAHKVPPTFISFYKHYCMTCSRDEVLIWSLKTASRVQRLKVNVKKFVVKKASFSNLGHIVVLYLNDTLQAWMINRLENDRKIDAKMFNMRNIRDFAFTTNGRAMIMAGAQNKIIVLSTCNWNVLKTLKLPDNYVGVKHLLVVPSPLDGGANKIIATVSLDCTLGFFDLDSACFLEVAKHGKAIKKNAVSPCGRYLAYIEREGDLNFVIADNEILVSEKCPTSVSVRKPCRPVAHGMNEHLMCIREGIKQELSLERLLPILKEFKEYPEKFRGTIWLNILELPGNRCAYSALANRASPSKFTEDLLKNYQLANRSRQALLATTLSCLAQWCPLLIQSTFLPNFIFPFVIVFEKDPMHGLELTVTILINYCQKWFEYHPLPPLNVLGIIENILLEADPSLLNFFCERGITSNEYAWPLLKSAMSEILSGSEWLSLWDHLISYRRPSLLLMCVVAYNIYSRETLMSLSNEDCSRFYTTQSHVRATTLLKIAQQLDQDVSSRIHPNRYLRDELITLPLNGSYPSPLLYIDYPKFLTDDISVLEMERLKEKEKTLQERSQKEVEKDEEERLQRELRDFMDRIHQKRLNGVQKCLRERSYAADWSAENILNELKTDENPDERIPPLKIGECVKNATKLSSAKALKKNSCKKFQEDVDKLEHEVQSLIDSLRSHRSKISVI